MACIDTFSCCLLILLPTRASCSTTAYREHAGEIGDRAPVKTTGDRGRARGWRGRICKLLLVARRELDRKPALLRSGREMRLEEAEVADVRFKCDVQEITDEGYDSDGRVEEDVQQLHRVISGYDIIE
jgi:hypothetical protein